MADKDLVDLMTGKLNPQKAFFQGKLKVQGNMGLAMKLQEFQKQASEAMKSKLWWILFVLFGIKYEIDISLKK